MIYLFLETYESKNFFFNSRNYFRFCVSSAFIKERF